MVLVVIGSMNTDFFSSNLTHVLVKKREFGPQREVCEDTAERYLQAKERGLGINQARCRGDRRLLLSIAVRKQIGYLRPSPCCFVTAFLAN